MPVVEAEVTDPFAVSGNRSALAYHTLSGASDGSYRTPGVVLIPENLQGALTFPMTLREAGVTGSIYAVMPPRGIYRGTSQCGVRWFHRAGGMIEPTAFIDALWHLERFVLDRLEASSAADSLVLIGTGEGALMALACAPYLHDRVSGIALVDAACPQVSGWAPPEVNLAGLASYVISTNSAPVHSSAEVVAWLRAFGCNPRLVQTSCEPSVSEVMSQVGGWVRSLQPAN